MSKYTPAAWLRIRGPLVVLAAIAILQLLADGPYKIPNPIPILLTLVVYVTYRDGALAGSIGGVLTAIFAGVYFYTPQSFDDPQFFFRLAVNTASTFAIVWMMAVMQRRARRATERLIEGERQTERQRGSAQYRALAEALPVIVWTADADGRVEYFNERWYAFSGLTAAESLGDEWVARVAAEDVASVHAAWSQAVASGGRYEVEYRVKDKHGEWHWFLVRGSPLRDARGQVVRWFGTCTDIDAPKRAQQESAFLLRVSSILNKSLDYDATIEELARLAVPAIADYCVIDVTGDDGTVDSLRLHSVAHTDPDKAELFRAFRARYSYIRVPNRGIAHTLASGEPEFVLEVPDEWVVAAARDAEHLQQLRALNFRSYIIVPLIARGHRLGTVSLVYTDSGRRYGQRDVALAQEFARHAAFAADNARLYEHAQAQLHARIEIEAQLKAAKQQYEDLMNSIDGVVWEFDLRAQRYTLVSEQVERALGYPRARWFDEPSFWADHVHPDDRARVLEFTATTQFLQPIYEMDYRMIAADGRTLWLRDKVSVVQVEGEPALLRGLVIDITDRQRIEDALRESEQRFRSVVESNMMGIGFWRADGAVAGANDALLAVLGYTRAELERGGIDWIKATPPEYAQRDRDAIAQVTATGVCAPYEKEFLRKDGTRVPILIGGAALTSARDRGAFFVLDLSAKRRAEEQVRQSQALFSKAFYASLDWMSISRARDGQFVDANDGFVQATGYTREELIGRSSAELGLWCDAAQRQAVLDGLRIHGRVQNLEVDFCPRVGARRSLLFSAETFDLDGVRHVLVSARDVSDRKRAEAQVSFQANLLNVVGQAVIATDLTGKVVYWNAFAETLYGWPAAEAVGRNVLELTPAEEVQAHAQEIMQALAQGARWHGEFLVRRRDGSQFLAQVTDSPIYNEHGELVGVVGVSADLTEQRRMEQDLIKVQKLESIGVLAGGIAHDFNNILTAILGNIALAKMYAQGEPRAAEVLEEAERAFWRARDLTQQLLTFAKGGAPIRAPVDLVPLLTDTPRFALTGSNVRCEVALPDDLWPVNVDAGQISQVINNLVLNAKQAMPQGGAINVLGENINLGEGEIGGLARGRYIKIAIADRGVGIASAHLGKIFDPYFTTKQKGTGLGLATSYSIVKRHDGHIAVESQLGRGTTFSIYLPASDALPQAESQTQPPLAGKGRILIMDDEQAILRVARPLLQSLGYEVLVAEHGEEALEIYQDALREGRRIDAVILDLTVPDGMGGLQCLARLRALDPNVRAIVSSGYSNDQTMAEYSKYGFKGVIAKPYQLVELSQVLQATVCDGLPPRV